MFSSEKTQQNRPYSPSITAIKHSLFSSPPSASQQPPHSEALLEKDKRISVLQSTVKKLQLKNKQTNMLENMVTEYEEKISKLEEDLWKVQQSIKGKEGQISKQKKRHQQLILKYEKTPSVDIQRTLKENEELKEINKHLSLQLKENKLNLDKVKTLQQENINLTKTTRQKKDISSLQNQNQQLRRQISSKTKQAEHYHQLYQQSQNQKQDPKPNIQVGNKKQEYRQVIDQYEEHIALMASKLSSVHGLQREVRYLKSEVQKWKELALIKEEQMKNKTKYESILENKIKVSEERISKQENTSQTIEQFMKKIHDQEQKIERMSEAIIQKDKQLKKLKQDYITLLPIVSKIQSHESSLQEIEIYLKETKKELNLQREKNYTAQQQISKLQHLIKQKDLQTSIQKSEVGKLNRSISQKMQKIEFQKIQIERLEKENTEKSALSEKCASLQSSIAEIEKKFEGEVDLSNQLSLRVIVLSSQVQRLTSEAIRNQKLLEDIKKLSEKFQTFEESLENIESTVFKFQMIFKKLFNQVKYLTERMDGERKKILKYEIHFDQMHKYLEKIQESRNQNYEQMDCNINTLLNFSEYKLKELEQLEESYEIKKIKSFAIEDISNDD